MADSSPASITLPTSAQSKLRTALGRDRLIFTDRPAFASVTRTPDDHGTTTFANKYALHGEFPAVESACQRLYIPFDRTSADPDAGHPWTRYYRPATDNLPEWDHTVAVLEGHHPAIVLATLEALAHTRPLTLDRIRLAIGIPTSSVAEWRSPGRAPSISPQRARSSS